MNSQEEQAGFGHIRAALIKYLPFLNCWRKWSGVESKPPSSSSSTSNLHLTVFTALPCRERWRMNTCSWRSSHFSKHQTLAQLAVCRSKTNYPLNFPSKLSSPDSSCFSPAFHYWDLCHYEESIYEQGRSSVWHKQLPDQQCSQTIEPYLLTQMHTDIIYHIAQSCCLRIKVDKAKVITTDGSQSNVYLNGVQVKQVQ